MDDVCFAPATEVAAAVRSGDRSPVAVVEAVLDRVGRRDGDLGAYVTVLADAAREAARAVERAVERGDDPGPLAGVPVALKDFGGRKAGVRHTCGSVPFRDAVADADATFVERLEAAGAVVVGVANAAEFGHKATTDNRLFGPTATPFDRDRNAGGSSGGSAAAVADGLAALAHGGDGGGSLRIPAAWCGVVGVKPTFRRVAAAARPDAFGAAAGHFTHHGPIARTVTDAAAMLSVMAGPHPRDPTALPDDGTDYLAATDRSIAGLEVAYTPDFGTFPVDDRVRAVVDDAVGAFERAGATVEGAGGASGGASVALPCSHDELTEAWLASVSAGYAAMADAMARGGGPDLLGDHRDDLSASLVPLIERGRDLSAVEYLRLHGLRTELFDAVEDVFESYDLLVSPTVACPPVENAADGETLGPETVAGEAVDPRIGWCLTHLCNFTGHPAASVPAGFTDGGLPVGLQVVAPRFADDRLLAACAAFERVRPWHGAYPPGDGTGRQYP